MVRKKQSVVSGQTSPPSPSPKGEGGQAEIGYTIGQWAGHEQYRCKKCAFDTLELDVMLDHLLRVHSVIASAPLPFPTSPPAPLQDGEGSERADGIFEIDLKEDQ
jgi:hypothetical protein